MQSRTLIQLAFPLFLLVPMCARGPSDDADDDDESGGAGGAAAGKAGASVGGASAGKGGAGAGGASAAAGKGGTGGTGGGTGGSAAGTGGTTGGSVNTGGGAGVTTGGTGGAQAGSSNGGTGNGGSSTGGDAGTGNAAGTGGGAGTSATGGTGGTGNMMPNVSGMPIPPGEGNVPRPSGAPGEITVLNWAGFEGAVTYTFDDNNSTQIQRYPEMQALGVRYTFFIWTGKSEASNAIWQTAKNDGHEIANHTQTHSSNGTTQDIQAAQTFIQDRFGLTAYTMAAPNGASVYSGLAAPLFLINRGVSNNLIAPNDNTDPFTLPTYIPPTGASESAFNQQVDDARSAGRWRTMCIHGFQGGSDGAYQPVPFDAWRASVEHAKELGDVWIDTLANVGAYWRGQKAFTQGMNMTSGSETTRTWTLPNNFPPGRYLRVTVGGGTLRQNGADIPWDSNGYYEIALDAESVTLVP